MFNKTTYDTPVLVFAEAASIIKKRSQRDVAESTAYITGKGKMNVYPDSAYYMATANFVEVDIDHQKNRMVGLVTNASQKIFHIKAVHYL